MKVLVIGSGGREHALVWKLSQSPRVKKIFCAPGSAAIAELAELVPIAPDRVQQLAEFAAREQIDLTVGGPELPLTLGIADVFSAQGLRLFGPDRAAAQLEGSKAFAKELLKENHIPTASFDVFTEATPAKQFLDQQPPPYVVKADGLAAGKGVLICANRDEAEAAIDEILVQKSFGQAGQKIVIEEFLEGEEASFMVLIDGEHILPLATSQDHKRVFDHDRGPNTGGMGAYSPAPVVTPQIHHQAMAEVMHPTVDGMALEARPYRGVLYAGLIISGGEVKTLEFNARFGDPECQPLLMRMKSDIVPILMAVADGDLEGVEIEWHDKAA